MSAYLIVLAILVAVVAWVIARAKRTSRAEPGDDDDDTEVTVSIEIDERAVFDAQPRRNPRLRSRKAAWRWLPPGERAHVCGYTIPGGMLYVGEGLEGVRMASPEPALINPKLRIDRRSPDHAGDHMGYWPSYTDIPPDSRAAYLDWLANGRENPTACIGYVFLFFYGLERRAFADQCNADELDAIRAEVQRLLSLYHHNRSFVGYATRFLAALDLATPEATPYTPRLDEPPGQGLSLSLCTAIGALARDHATLPDELALAWVWEDKDKALRTAARRCPRAFQRLFRHRYRERFGTGLALSPTSTQLKPRYHPASLSFGGEITLDAGDNLSDISTMPEIREQLAELAQQCTDELAAYSRFVGRGPEQAQSLAASATVPPAIFNADDFPAAAALAQRLDAALGAATHTALPLAELLEYLPSTTTGGRLSRADAITLAAVMGRLGCGLSPDLRFSGVKPRPGDTVIVFRLTEPAQDGPGTAYRRAALALRLASRVVDGTDGAALEPLLTGAAPLDEDERRRLQADHDWFARHDPGLAGLKAQTRSLNSAQRSSLGEYLITLAASAGDASGATVRTLQTLFRRLELDPDAVVTQLHQASTGPVTVRPTTPHRGYAIPRPNSDGEPEDHSATPPAPAATGPTLDPEEVARKLAETEQAATLLGQVFGDGGAHDEEPAESATTTEPSAATAGLDAAHAGLLAALGGQDEWQRTALEALATQQGLMLDGALEAINEAAFEHCDAPCIEEDGEAYVLDREVYEELTA